MYMLHTSHDPVTELGIFLPSSVTGSQPVCGKLFECCRSLGLRMPQSNSSNVYKRNYENKCWKDIYYAGFALFTFNKAEC